MPNARRTATTVRPTAFDSAALVHDYRTPPDQSERTVASTTSDITMHDLYIEGAVDPKTHRKWVWAFIDANTNLIDTVVSFKLTTQGRRRVLLYIVRRRTVPVATKKHGLPCPQRCCVNC